MRLTFTDTAFQAPFVLQSSSCSPVNSGCMGYAPPVNLSFTPNTLQLDFNYVRNGDTFVFTEPSAVAVTPEPNSLALAATGVAGMACMLHRRYAS